MARSPMQRVVAPKLLGVPSRRVLEATSTDSSDGLVLVIAKSLLLCPGLEELCIDQHELSESVVIALVDALMAAGDLRLRLMLESVIQNLKQRSSVGRVLALVMSPHHRGFRWVQQAMLGFWAPDELRAQWRAAWEARARLEQGWDACWSRRASLTAWRCAVRR